MEKCKKVGIALGSGSARGWSHIGVLKALAEEKIKIDYIAGTSIGALVGAIYASGDINSLEKFALGITWKTIVSYLDITLPRNGLISGKKISKLLSEYFSDKTIESLKVPFCSVSVDILNGEEVWIKTGKIIEAVRASISIPGIIIPYKKNKRYLVDGGVLNPLPINVVKDMGAEIIIAVDLNSCLLEKERSLQKNKNIRKEDLKEKIDTKNEKRNNQLIHQIEKGFANLSGSVRSKIKNLKKNNNNPNIFEIMGNTTSVMQNKITQMNLESLSVDFLIQPQLKDFKLLDFDRADVAIKEGYCRTKPILSDLKEKILQ